MIFAGLSVAFLVAIFWHYFSRASIPHETIRLHLRLTASSIYEFHKAMGRWPAAADDLASTSLPQTSPYWRTLIDNGSVAVVWDNDLKPDPKETNISNPNLPEHKLNQFRAEIRDAKSEVNNLKERLSHLEKRLQDQEDKANKEIRAMHEEILVLKSRLEKHLDHH